MNQIHTTGIVLRRTNFQEADKILMVLTPDYGKLNLIAKGVRRSKSKLAGGVEFFSISEIGFIKGRGDISTLTSARLVNHFGKIVKDINRTMLGYELIKLINKATEENPESEYYYLLIELMTALDNHDLDLDIIKLWFYAQLLRQAGHTPNLVTDYSKNLLLETKNYNFAYEDMNFVYHPDGQFRGNNIKFLRLVFSGKSPLVLQRINNIETIVPVCLALVNSILPNHIRT